MKMDCQVIGDLLALYAEDMLSERSRELVDEHLAECPACREALERMRRPAPPLSHSAQPLRALRRLWRRHTLNVALLSVFAAAAAAILVWGLFFLRPGDEMGYSLVCFYLFLPLTAFVCCLLAATRRGAVKWLLPAAFGGAGAALPWLVFGAGGWAQTLASLVPALLGLGLGCLAGALRRRKK
ncbi:MAG: anti-sigma factor family protein [Oscillospiraceae bacterium]